ncbi:choline dehydrogenase [Paraburkholderia bannensis]|uniref:choline dehydrogenase n=1 Tax=Paraburkholderia bannensis TaxID=765414 RepID=UPI002AC354EC|nr:choline dehydrogenase [Paraburkholderia bannensis]
MTESTKKYDYVVIGAGSAGCVVANRLSSSGTKTVLLVEAGPSDNSVILKMPAAMGLPLESTRFNWKYLTEPESGLNDRVSEQHRGKVLGGSSSINGMIFNRGNPRDFDQWSEIHGLTDWAFANCLPYFRKMETFDGGGDTYRGADGPLYVHRCRAENPLYHAFIRAGEDYGLPLTSDQNGFRQEGVHIAQVTIRDGVRQSTSEGYLKPARNRENLSVETNATVRKILFSGKRAFGVHYVKDGVQRTVEALEEIILCAGAIGSPHLLMLSGVGDADQLRRANVGVVEHLPGVGSDMQDHIGVPIQYATTQSVSPTKQLGPISRIVTGAKWVLTKSGLGASNFFEVGAFFRSDDNKLAPDIQHEFFPMVGMYHQGKSQAWDGFQYFTSIMHPKSRGNLRLKSANPDARPEIRFNYFSDPEDIKTLANGVKQTREMVKQRGWDSLRSTELSPGVATSNQSELEAWIRANAGSGYHPIATCRMGHDELSVTDQSGRVHGLDGLRVVDASLMPSLPTGNTNAATIMMAEKIADMMLGKVLAPTPVKYA